MPDLGSFPTYSDALLAACPKILSLPHAVASHPSDFNFELRWSLSKEDCAWIYDTPDGLYIVAYFARTDTGRPTCSGFFLYMPATGEILKWTVDEHGEWKKKQYGKVTWKNASDFDVERLP